MEKIKINKEDAQTVLKLIRLIENMSLSYYNKNWRKVHKKAGINAQYKIQIKDFTIRRDRTKKILYAYETRNNKKKQDKFKWLMLTYKNYGYRVTYDDKTDKFEVQSAYNNYKNEIEIIKED